MNCAIYKLIEMQQAESHIFRIMLSRKHKYEAIMSRLHFAAIKKGATKKFSVWLDKRYKRLQELTCVPLEQNESKYRDNLALRVDQCYSHL